jgi:hypothetical protein
MADELKDEVIEVGVGNVEALVDQVLDNGLLRALPILDTLVSFAKIGMTIRDRLFITKVHRFLFALTTVTEEERRRFCEELTRDEKLRKKTGEVIVLLLDRFDDLEKPQILAKLLAALMKGKISYGQFRRLAHAIGLGYIEDLKQLATLKEKIPTESKSGLLITGLTEISRMESPRKTGLRGDQQIVMQKINITNLGKLFIQIMEEEKDTRQTG